METLTAIPSFVVIAAIIVFAVLVAVSPLFIWINVSKLRKEVDLLDARRASESAKAAKQRAQIAETLNALAAAITQAQD